MLRATIIQVLGLPPYATDDEIIAATKRLKSGADISTHSAITLSRMATEYQQRLAKLGETIDFATAVRAVEAGGNI